MRKMAIMTALLVSACGEKDNHDSIAGNEEAVTEVQCPATLPPPIQCKAGWIYDRYKSPCYQSYEDPVHCPAHTQSDPCHICYHVSGGHSVQPYLWGPWSQTCSYTVGTPKGCNPSTSYFQNQCQSDTLNFRQTVAGDINQVVATGVLRRAKTGGGPDEGYITWSNTCYGGLSNTDYSGDPICTTGPMTTCTRVLDHICADPSHPEVPGQCGIDLQNPYLSAAGLTLSAAQAADRYWQTGNCASGEDIADDTPAAASAKARTLLARYNGQDARTAKFLAAVKPGIAAELVRIFELHGDAFDADTRAAILAFYADPTVIQTTCGQNPDPGFSASCTGYAQSKNILGPMRACRRLLSLHVPGALRRIMADSCSSLAQLVPASDTDPCAPEARTRLGSLASDFLHRLFDEITVDATDGTLAPERWSGIDVALASLGSFYRAATVAWDEVQAGTQLSGALRYFWSAVYGKAFPLPSTFPAGTDGSDQARQQLAGLSGSHFAADRAVLVTALANPAPLTGAPLFDVISDGLGGAARRLAEEARYYDFACRFEGCVGKKSEATDMVALLGKVLTRSELDTALGATTVRAEWLRVFRAMDDHYDLLVSSLADILHTTTADPSTLLSGDPPARAAALASLVRRARVASTNYANTGLFDPRAAGVLRTGLGDDKRVAVTAEFETQRTNLRARLQGYTAARGDFANTLLDALRTDAGRARAQAEIAVLDQEILARSQDAKALQDMDSSSQRDLADFMASVLAEVQKPGWPQGYAYNPINFAFNVSALDSRATHNFVSVGTPDLPTDVSKTAILTDRNNPASPVWKRTVAPGDILQLTLTGGQWAPTCALREMRDAHDPFTWDDTTNALTGPEGYGVTVDNGKAKLSNVTDGWEINRRDTSSACGTLGLGYLGSSIGDTMCRSYEIGEQFGMSTSNQDSTNVTAHFAQGLRSKQAPFPALPAGALILVEVTPDAQGQPHFHDMSVVRSHSTFTFDQAGDVYLIVNDRSECHDVNDSALSFQGTHAQSAERAAQQVATAMSAALGEIRSRRAAIIQTGSLSAADLDQIRRDAYASFFTSCGPNCTIDQFPPVIGALWEKWLAAELASLDRQVRILNLNREMDQLVLRREAQLVDIVAAQDQSRLQELMNMWQLRDLAQSEVRDTAQFVFEEAIEYVYPMLQLRYPTALAVIQNEASLETVRTADWTRPLEDLIANMLSAADVVGTRLSQAQLDATNRPTAMAVYFPKPNAGSGGGPFAPTASGMHWVTASPTLLDRVWESYQLPDGTTDYRLRRTATFEIAPEDVYKNGDGQLFCFEATPIVRRMAVYALNNGDARNGAWNTTTSKRRAMHLLPEGLYTHEIGGLRYRIGTAGWLDYGVRILAGVEDTVFADFGAYASAEVAAAGLSPFNSFTIDFDTYLDDGELLTVTTGVLVLFDVDARGATAPLGWLDACNH